MKKKILFISLMIFSFVAFLPIVFADDPVTVSTVCNSISPNLVLDEKIPNTVHIIILCIQIAVPIVLVVLGMLDLFKAITAGKDEEIKKAQGLFVKRLISAALVFFVIAIVKLVFSVIGESDKGTWKCIDCFLEGSEKCIEGADD